jgi:hypothetical protein
LLSWRFLAAGDAYKSASFSPAAMGVAGATTSLHRLFMRRQNASGLACR